MSVPSASVLASHCPRLYHFAPFSLVDALSSSGCSLTESVPLPYVSELSECLSWTVFLVLLGVLSCIFSARC